jgi:hypothetical protein
MRTFNFCKQSVKHDGTVTPGRLYPVKASDDNEISLRQVNALRMVAFNLIPLNEERSKDGKDVSGAGVNSPSQIIWDGTRYIGVAYSQEYVRVSESNSDSIMNVAEWMLNHMKRTGKPAKGTPAALTADPIYSYDQRVANAITGRMKQHVIKSDKPLTIDLTGIDGFDDDTMAYLTDANEIIGCNVKWVLS